MDKSSISFISLLFLFFCCSTNTFADDIANLGSLESTGNLSYTTLGVEGADSDATLKYTQITLQNKHCKALSLEAVLPADYSNDDGTQAFEKQYLLSIIECDKEYFLCPALAPSECTPGDYVHSTVKKGNTLQLYSDNKTFSNIVEITDTAVTYSVKTKSCLISYPHGCLIKGNKWETKEAFQYVRKH